MDVNAFLAHRRSLATPSGEIAYTELGAGPAALFVHGVGTSGALWRQVIAELSDTSRCIAVDLPAHGASPARDDMAPALTAWPGADDIFQTLPATGLTTARQPGCNCSSPSLISTGFDGI